MRREREAFGKKHNLRRFKKGQENILGVEFTLEEFNQHFDKIEHLVSPLWREKFERLKNISLESQELLKKWPSCSSNLIDFIENFKAPVDKMGYGQEWLQGTESLAKTSRDVTNDVQETMKRINELEEESKSILIEIDTDLDDRFGLGGHLTYIARSFVYGLLEMFKNMLAAEEKKILEYIELGTRIYNACADVLNATREMILKVEKDNKERIDKIYQEEAGKTFRAEREKTNEHNELQKQVAELNTRINQLEQELAESDGKNKELERELRAVEREHAAKFWQLELYYKQKDELRNERDENLKFRLEDAKMKYDSDVLALRIQLERQKDEYEWKLKLVEKDAKTEIRRLEEKFEEQIEDLKQRLSLRTKIIGGLIGILITIAVVPPLAQNLETIREWFSREQSVEEQIQDTGENMHGIESYDDQYSETEYER